MKRSAFLYRNKYYLVPEKYRDYDVFAKTIALEFNGAQGKNPFVEVPTQKLSERKCFPPYFVSEHAQPVTLKIRQSEAMFGIEAELLSMKEYNQRLRLLVKEYCPGCCFYGEVNEKDSSLKGHHEEISLNGVCFTRQDNDAQTHCMHDGFQEFMAWFRDTKDDLEALIDLGQYDVAAEEIALALDGLVMPRPPFLFAGKRDGMYFCAVSGGMNDVLGLLLSYVCVQAGEQKIPGWNFYEYIPKGALDLCVQDLPVPAIEIQQEDFGPPFLSVTLGLPAADEQAFYSHYLALCNLLGEQRLRNAVLEIRISQEPIEDVGVWVLDEQIEQVIAKLKAIGYTQERIVVPPFFLTATGSADLPEPDSIATIRVPRLYEAVEQSPTSVFACAEELEWVRVPIGVLQVNYPSSPGETEPKGKSQADIAMDMMEDLRKRGLAKVFAITMHTECTRVCFLIMKKDAALMAIRRISPVFRECAATLRVIEPEGIFDYEVSFDMKLVGKMAMDAKQP